MDIKFSATEFQKIAGNYKGGDRIVKQETIRAVERSVKEIDAGAKRLVPVLTHNLQRSITNEVTTSGRDVIGRAGTNVVYSQVVEYGHPRWPNRRARPYLNPAYQSLKGTITKELGTALMQRIMKRVGNG